MFPRMLFTKTEVGELSMNRFLLLYVVVTSLVWGRPQTAEADEPADATATTSTDPVASGRTARPRTAETRYDWKWLAARYDGDDDGVVSREELPVSDDILAGLDRTWDGQLTSEDFDWSENSVLRLQKDSIFALSKSVDQNSDGRIDADEWRDVFASAVEGDGYLSDDDLERLIFLPRVAKAQREAQRRSGRLDLERRASRHEPPQLGALAPDFSLSSPDGSATVRLSSFRGKKAVVLIFGSFT